jgi:hypothetical protein
MMSVSNPMREKILLALRQLESERSIRVLYAAESGSRAWGFASPNSDYDVRFLYVPRPEWYFSVGHKRDVIERMLPGDLDLSGWELRKALRLLRRYNGALYEWLGSPICYRGDLDAEGDIACELRAMMSTLFKPAAALHHYGSMAKSALESMPQDGAVSIKKLCYLLRSLFACRHVLRCKTQPPTLFTELLSEHARSAAEREWIDGMLAQKALASEKAEIELSAAQRSDWASEMTEALAARATIMHGRRSMANSSTALDELLCAAVQRAWRS